MSVLTEITNSDKDLLLSGDCTIKTKVLVSDSQDNGPTGYEMTYDSENDRYYLYGESTQETRSGKNLFDVNYTYEVGNTHTFKGVSITYENNGYITLNGTVETNGDLNILSTGYTITLNKDIYLIFEALSGSASNSSRGVSVQAINKSGASVWSYSANANAPIKKVPYSEITSIKWIRISLVVGESFNNYKFRFWVSTENSLNYEPYGVMPSPDYPSEVKSITGKVRAILANNKLATFDLRDNDLCSIGDVKDELIVENGKAKILKKIGKVILNGSEDWLRNGETTNYGQYVLTITDKEYGLSNIISDKFITELSNTKNCIAGRDNSKNVSITIVKSIVPYNISEFKTWLSTHNTTVYYVLAEPYEIDIPNYTETDLTILTEENSVKNWNIADDRYVPDIGVIGQFVAREINGELQNISDDFNIEDKHIQVQMGISQLGSSTTNWYSLGTFIITKPTDDEVADNTRFNGYDLATKFNIPFDADFTSEDYPKSFNTILKEQNYTTNGWLAGYACSQVGIELATTDFIHSDFRILSNQFTSGESCRDVMKYISQLAFGYCEIYWDDKCYIRNISTDYSSFDDYHKLNYDMYYDLDTQKNTYGPVNRLFCGLQDVEGQGATLVDTTTIDQGETTINIYNNPLTMGTSLEISQQLQLEAIQGGNILWGLKYRPIVSTETIGHPWFKAYEPIELSDMENNKSITYPFSHNIKYTGHIKSDISSEGETKAENTYGYKDSITRKMNRIGINVDRANEKITIINQKITDIDGEISDIKGQIIEIGDVYTKAEIRDIVSGVGVDGTVVTSVETATTIFDINGMTIGRTDAQTKTNINANGMIISNANDNTELLKINNSGVYSENLTARTYLNLGVHGRFEEYEEYGQTRMGCFWVKGGNE